MTYRLSPPVCQFIGSDGNPLAGGLLSFYATGTSTPANTYQDSALTIANANPIVLDSAGYAPSIFLTPGQQYKVVLTDANNVQQWAQDPVSDPTSGGGNFTSVVAITDGAGATKSLFLETAGVKRFGLISDASAEAGANAGSNLSLVAYDDAGNALHTVFIVNRSTGALDFQTTPTFNGGGLIPAGTVEMFAGQTAPLGWHECDGSAISRTANAALFAAISTTYGVGDGSTTFNLPDMRGQFPRGWDHGAGVDSGRAFGSTQADQLQDHIHNIQESVIASGPASGEAVPLAGGTTIASTTNPVTGSHGAETRPKNIALLFIIKT